MRRTYSLAPHGPSTPPTGGDERRRCREDASRGLGSCDGNWVFVIAHASPYGIDASAHRLLEGRFGSSDLPDLRLSRPAVRRRGAPLIAQAGLVALGAGPHVPVTSEPWTPRLSWIADVPDPGLVCAGSAAAGPAFRFVLVSVLRGQCPWLSVRSGGWEPAGTDR